MSSSEWAEYTVNVATSGTYTVSARVATQTANGSSLRILFDGKKVGTLAVPNTGEWQTYTTVSTQVNLEGRKSPGSRLRGAGPPPPYTRGKPGSSLGMSRMTSQYDFAVTASGSSSLPFHRHRGGAREVDDDPGCHAYRATVRRPL
ncbi:carbohydrate-binding protein [Cystobacter fuscus]|uniref:carbohydrate-binding protein n=1 Tax=Cystobacter fuscus TaxID=43 RepID=UPI0022B75C37|nr:carbohydrate-binding protein [Cystobacter fuscus]